jgi:copper chaperone CopZ
MQKYTFHVSGTHCASCKILIEDILKEQDFIKTVEVNLKNKTVLVESDQDVNNKGLVRTTLRSLMELVY